jgi:uncharacterized protein
VLSHGLALFVGWSKYSIISLSANYIGALKSLLTFFGIAILVYGSMHLYAFAKVWQAFAHSTVLGLALLLLGIVLTLSPFSLWFLARQGWHSATAALSWPIYIWMGFIFLFCVIGFATDLGSLITTLLGFRWPLSSLQTLLAITLLTASLSVYGFYDARQIRTERINLTTPKLHGRPVTIIQISDLHLGSMLGDAFLGRVMQKVCAARPDTLVATGDIVDAQRDHLNGLEQHFRDCNPPLGKYAVLGNHEYYVGMEESLRFLHDAGFTVLRGDAVAAGGIVIAGVDDPAGISQGKPSHLNAAAALKTMPRDAFVVLLKHQPVVDLAAPFDLQLSGHIHAGQIFPFNFFTWLTYKVRAGLTLVAPNRWLYVSRGTGTWGPPIRLLAPPEITVITIEPSGHGQ